MRVLRLRLHSRVRPELISSIDVPFGRNFRYRLEKSAESLCDHQAASLGDAHDARQCARTARMLAVHLLADQGLNGG